ncbi:DoxX family protein [Amycolatopsis sp. lyj-108]|uniref:DoxX family protein n=1 Tax=Amycolatopsis sp. lyj-108 TaxID=2789286 RepID=UPI003978275E
MRTRPSDSHQHATGWSRIRPIAFWFTTFVIVFELIAGSTWNLFTIDWTEAQFDHLGYPDYFAHILGVCHIGAAVTIAVPGFRLIKEWAYAGISFLWSGAVVSHLALGDGLVSWGPPLMFLAFAVASWVLRPADRRLPETRLRRSRPADAGQDKVGRAGNRPRAWAVSIGLVVVLSAVSLLTLPAAEDVTREWIVERGWVAGLEEKCAQDSREHTMTTVMPLR